MIFINSSHKVNTKIIILGLELENNQNVDKEFLGHICTAMMLNEMEIITWCYTLYLVLS